MQYDAEINEFIFHAIENLIVIIDPTGTILRMNPVAQRTIDLADPIGKSIWDIFGPAEERKAAQERFARILAGDWPLRYEREWVSREGVRRLIRWSMGVPRDADGNAKFLVATGTDMTDAKRAEGAETALRDQTRLLLSVLDSVGDGVAVANEAAKIIIYTPEMERIVGRPRTTLAPEQWAEYFHFFLPDGVTPFSSDSLPMARAMRGEASDDIEIQIRHPDWSEPRWCSVNGRPLRNELGQVCGGVVASRDITERKRAENETRFRKSLLEAQMESSIDGILVVDAYGKILLSNSRFASMMGVPDDVVRKGIDDDAIAETIQQVQEPDEFIARIKWLYEHPEEQSREEVRFKDGRIIDRFSAPVRTPASEGPPIVHYGRVWIFRDITELKDAEAAARRSADVARSNEAHFRELAEHTRRLAREIDHRVGNNLAALLGLVAVTRTRAASVDALADAIHNRLLAMAHVHHMLRQANWARLSLAELISSVRANIVQPHDKVHFVLDGPQVWIEPRQVSPLTMVVVELLTNSTKYGVHGAAGGSLAISWQVVSSDVAESFRPWLRISWKERGGPPITGPIIPSLGSELVEGFITHELFGRCELRYLAEGVDHLIEFPLPLPGGTE